MFKCLFCHLSACDGCGDCYTPCGMLYVYYMLFFCTHNSGRWQQNQYVICGGGFTRFAEEATVRILCYCLLALMNNQIVYYVRWEGGQPRDNCIQFVLWFFLAFFSTFFGLWPMIACHEFHSFFSVGQSFKFKLDQICFVHVDWVWFHPLCFISLATVFMSDIHLSRGINIWHFLWHHQ